MKILHDDPPMPEEIAAGFYPRFEDGWRVVEIAGRWLMAAFVLACALGALGRGLFSVREARNADDTISIAYEPIVRFGAPTDISFVTKVPPGPMHVAVSWLKLRFVRFERIVDGTPIVIYRDGRFEEVQMRRLRMQQADVRTAARQSGLDDMAKVATAVVERDGKISIIEAA